MRPTDGRGGAFEYYVRKNYYKTGSLMANSCKAAAVLGDHTLEVGTTDHVHRAAEPPGEVLALNVLVSA